MNQDKTEKKKTKPKRIKSLACKPKMAPPTPVYKRADIRSQYKEQLNNPEKYQCQLRSLVQHECTFKVSSNHNPPEIICLPFKRVFQRCLVPSVQKKDGKKTKGSKWINIEITDASTNSQIKKDDQRYGKEVQDFMNAEKEFREFMEKEWHATAEAR